MQQNNIVRKPNNEQKIVRTKSFFEKLKTLTDFMGLKSSILPSNPENLTPEQLVIALEDKEDPIAMQIMFITDSFEEKKSKESVILQMMISFPIYPKERNIFGLAALITRLNPVLPVGSFGITPSDNLYLRHTIMAKDKESIDKPVIVEVMDIMTFFANMVGEKLSLFVEDKLTFENCLKEIEEIMTSN